MSSKAIIHKLEQEYRTFFKEAHINPNTGKINNPDAKNLKFATHPFVGTKYGEGKRILFIGLDIGADEYKNSIGTCDQRRESIENRPEHNTHISGTCILAIKNLGWNDVYNKIANEKSFQAATKHPSCLHLLKKGKNPLSYIALTNYFKWVVNSEKRRSHNKNRRHIKGIEEKEINLLIREIQILSPEIIIFQGVEFFALFTKEIMYKLKKIIEGKYVYIAHHPSHRNNKKTPSHYINKLVTRIY